MTRIFTGLMAFWACSAAFVPALAEQADRPNVAVVLIDTLRPDHLRAWGYSRETAEFLSTLATRAAVFRNAVSSSSWTAPATASLFTSLYPTHHGVVRGFFATRQQSQAIEREGKAAISINRIPESVRTLPEILRAAGYRTFGVAANLNIGPEIGFARGFERFSRLGDVESARKIGDDAPAEQAWARLLEWEPELKAASPRLLYVHLNDPHGPYTPHQPWFGRAKPDEDRTIAAYDSEISYADDVIRQIAERFELAKDVVVVVSDHGNAFGEHGKQGHGPRAGLYGAVNRIVLMISAPQLGVDPQVVDERVSIIDVLPTILELCGLPPVPGDGRSLVTRIRGASDQRERAAVELRQRTLLAHTVAATRGGPDQWAVAQAQWKMMRSGKNTQLFDLSADPREQHDLSAAQPAVVAKLDRELASFLKASRVGDKTRVNLGPAELEHLRSLGYAD